MAPLTVLLIDSDFVFTFALSHELHSIRLANLVNRVLHLQEAVV